MISPLSFESVLDVALVDGRVVVLADGELFCVDAPDAKDAKVKSNAKTVQAAAGF